MRALAWAWAAATVFLQTGCALLHLQDEVRQYEASVVVVGRVLGPGRAAPTVVMALDTRSGSLVHHTRLHEPGGYELLLPAGAFRVVAFSDDNGNGRHDAGEAWGESGQVVDVKAGAGVVKDVDVRLSTAAPAPRPLPQTPAPAPHDPGTGAGALAELAAPRLSRAAGEAGYWAPVSTFRAFGGNVYFLEPFDPDRIPVLFVHGAAGSAQDWRHFIGRLDRTRFQPWLYVYPSGVGVESAAHLLFWKLFNLRQRHDFPTLVVAAHSMGGLVARALLVQHGEHLPEVRLLASLSTPWGGEPLAGWGIRMAPAGIPSWHDLLPTGAVARRLFARPMPSHVRHVLYFGHRGAASPWRGNSDGVVTLASQLHAPAQAEAQALYGFDEDHDSILTSPAVVAHFAAELDRLQAPAAQAARGARSRTATFDLVDADRMQQSRRAPGAPLQSDPRIEVLRIRLRGEGDDRLFTPGTGAAPDAARAQAHRYDGGRLVLLGVRPGEYELRVEAAGYLPHTSCIRVDADGPSRSTVVPLVKAPAAPDAEAWARHTDSARTGRS